MAIDMATKSMIRDLIANDALTREAVVLSGGATVPYYFDLRVLTLNGDVAPLIGRLMLELTNTAGWHFDAVGGLTLGADPVAVAIMQVARAIWPVNAFVVRRRGKDHGLQKRIEGPSITGRRVLIVDDTTTTGQSALTAAEAAREAGADVVGVAVVVDRLQGAAEAIQAAGLPFLSLFTIRDFGLEP
jgi:orotate phosphoribosyltransferase